MGKAVDFKMPFLAVSLEEINCVLPPFPLGTVGVVCWKMLYFSYQVVCIAAAAESM